MLPPSSTLKLILLLLLCLSGVAQAAYITDQIEVDIYAQPFGKGAKLATLTSGASVEVLSSDGDYARILTANNLTGWIEVRYLTDSQPILSTIQALQIKSRDQEAELLATKETLNRLQKSGINDANLKKLRKDAKDAGWLRVELKKARDKVKQLETTVASTSSETTNTQQELNELRSLNADMAQRLAAALLISEHQQSAEITMAPEENGTEVVGQPDSADNSGGTATAQDWPLSLKWFLGSIFTAMLIGIILGIIWMDKRMRRRHGGFRLY